MPEMVDMAIGCVPTDRPSSGERTIVDLYRRPFLSYQTCVREFGDASHTSDESGDDEGGGMGHFHFESEASGRRSTGAVHQ